MFSSIFWWTATKTCVSAYLERHHRLKEIVSDTPGLLIADLFLEGEHLWNWAEARGWEGIVMKRLSSPYREGKKHRDWYKKRLP